jgi:hypothetical protein
MTALSDTQHQVLGALLGPGEADAALSLLRCSHGIGAAQRLQIYRNNLFESLTQALAAVYPVVAQLVGEAYFRHVARRFIAEHPLASGNLHGFGRELPAALAALPSAAELPYLADVAALEWAWHEVYHEAEWEPLQPTHLGEVPAAQQMDLGLQLAPAARLIASAYPILHIWQAHQRHDDASASAGEFAISLDEGGVRLLVLRRTLEIEFVLLDGAEDRWLRSLAAGSTLAEATLAAFEEDPAFDLAATLCRHLSLGSFAALSFAALTLSDPETADLAGKELHR